MSDNISINKPINSLNTNQPLDIRTLVNSYSDIFLIPNPYIGMTITVKSDETNDNKMTDYKVKSLKSNELGMNNTVIDEIERLDVYVGMTEIKTSLDNITKVTLPGVTTDFTAENTIRYKVQGRLNSLNLTIKGVNYPTKNTWTKIAQLNSYTGDTAYFFTVTVDSGTDTASSVIAQIDNTGVIMIIAPKILTNSVIRGCCSWIN